MQLTHCRANPPRDGSSVARPRGSLTWLLARVQPGGSQPLPVHRLCSGGSGAPRPGPALSPAPGRPGRATTPAPGSSQPCTRPRAWSVPRATPQSHRELGDGAPGCLGEGRAQEVQLSWVCPACSWWEGSPDTRRLHRSCDLRGGFNGHVDTPDFPHEGTRQGQQPGRAEGRSFALTGCGP